MDDNPPSAGVLVVTGGSCGIGAATARLAAARGWSVLTRSHHHTRLRAVVIGRLGILHFGVVDGAVYVFRPDGDYATLPAGSDEAVFEGYAGRRFAPGAVGAPLSLIGDFSARIEAGDTSTRSLDMQAHVLEIILKAYEFAGSNGPVPIVNRF